MRRKSFWTLGLVACLALAIVGFADHKPGHKKPGGGGGGGKVSLIGTFRDSFSPGAVFVAHLLQLAGKGTGNILPDP